MCKDPLEYLGGNIVLHSSAVIYTCNYFELFPLQCHLAPPKHMFMLVSYPGAFTHAVHVGLHMLQFFSETSQNLCIYHGYGKSLVG